MLYSSKLDTVHIIKTMKMILKISNTILVKVIFTFVPGHWVRPRDCEPGTRWYSRHQTLAQDCYWWRHWSYTCKTAKTFNCQENGTTWHVLQLISSLPLHYDCSTVSFVTHSLKQCTDRISIIKKEHFFKNSTRTFFFCVDLFYSMIRNLNIIIYQHVISPLLIDNIALTFGYIALKKIIKNPICSPLTLSIMMVLMIIC